MDTLLFFDDLADDDDIDSLFFRLLYEAAYVLYAFPYQILLSISKAFDRRAKKREISRIF